MENKIKIKNRDGKLFGEIMFQPDFKFNSEDKVLSGELEEVAANGVRITYHNKAAVITQNDPLFPIALIDYLRRRGYMVDDWEDYRKKIKEELAHYPQGLPFVKKTLVELDSMSKLELSYLLKMLTSGDL